MIVPQHYLPMLEILKEINKNTIPNPMPESEIEKLSFSKYRTNNGETVPLPASLQLLLSYDRDFMMAENVRLLQPLVENIDPKTGIIASYDIDGYFKKWFPEMPMHWNFLDGAPALIPLNHTGDQLIFFYASAYDDNNECPICRFDQGEFCLWITAAYLFHHIGDYMRNDDVSEDDSYLKKIEEKYASFFEKEYLNV